MIEISTFSGEYSFLSNFYPCKIEWDGHEYPSVEHAYQAVKTLDQKIRQTIRDASTPGRAKSLGRHVHLRPDWMDIRVMVMRSLMYRKFSQEPFRSLLLETKNAYLIEGNTWNDTFWGMCQGVGKNILGELLMEVRTALNSKLLLSASVICREY